MLYNKRNNVCVVIVGICSFIIPGVVTTRIDVPLLDRLEAPLKAELDISKLTDQIRALIKEEVKITVDNSLRNAVKNVKEQLKEDYRAERLKWLVPYVSFHARVRSPIPDIDPDATVIFNSVLTNNGKGYDPVTGVFTVPVKGTYLFSSTILTKKPSALELVLRVNGTSKMYMYASSMNETYNNAANSVILNLDKGDLVKIVKSGIYGSRPFYIHGSFSTFTGMLISNN